MSPLILSDINIYDVLNNMLSELMSDCLLGNDSTLWNIDQVCWRYDWLPRYVLHHLWSIRATGIPPLWYPNVRL